VQLIPRDAKFYDLFRDQAASIQEAARKLVPVFEDFREVEKAVTEIKFVEHKGDQIIHNLMAKLNQTFITPFDLEDIHALASTLDDVLDRIVKTMGMRITKLRPVGGFCAEGAAAISILGAAVAGTPVLTTHTIAGGIMGIGSVQRLSAVRWSVATTIVWAWILTIPVTGAVGALCFWLLHQIFSAA